MSDSRKRFEEWAGSAPFEYDLSRFPEHHIKHSWPGQYRRIEVQFAWQAWSARDSEVERLREALEHIVRRLQMDIDDGSRPDQWSMEDLVRKANSALSSQDKESA